MQVYDMIAYCFKCKKKQQIEHPKETILQNGKSATSGVCGKCASKLFSIGSISSKS
jgi:hypothetical protein|tara:strand:- start:451 stop:618 length:168 start_codon:yes stop_codon:yes gene_type:complete